MPAYECPICHRPLFSPNETCGGSFTEDDHPSAVKAVPAATLKETSPTDGAGECDRVAGGWSCSGGEERYVRDEISRTVNALVVACGNLLSVREHSPASLDSEFTEFMAEYEHAASFFALLFDWGRSAPDDWRSIELVETMGAWGASKDQEGIEWLTCHGRPVLNLRLAFQRAAQRHDGPAAPDCTEQVER